MARASKSDNGLRCVFTSGTIRAGGTYSLVKAPGQRERHMTDEEAIRMCQEGNRDAFHHLVEQYKDTLYGTAVLMTGNRSSADDQVQEAFLSAWRGIGKFRRGSPFKPWIVRILVNGVLTQRRRRAVETEPIGEYEPEGDFPDIVESVEAKRKREMVRRAIGSLDPQHREVVVLRYFADMTVPEIAVSAGIREGTAKSRLHRALGRLREELGQLAKEGV